MLALIDADVLLYQMGALSDNEGHPLAWNLVKMRVDERIYDIMTGAECDDYKLFLTGKSNFRIKEATILPYKGNRVSEKPYWHSDIKKYFMESNKHKGKVVFSEYYEADDAMSIALKDSMVDAYERYQSIIKDDPVEEDIIGSFSENISWLCESVLCSIDKDLNMCPGKHSNWHKKNKEGNTSTNYIVSETDGRKFFFQQLLTGDMTDNIKGLYKVGPVNAKKLLGDVTEPVKLYSIVQEQYEKRFGSYWKMFMHENARLLWMLETEDDDVRVWLEELHNQMLDEVVATKETEEVF